jgi:hypothetical protein
MALLSFIAIGKDLRSYFRMLWARKSNAPQSRTSSLISVSWWWTVHHWRFVSSRCGSDSEYANATFVSAFAKEGVLSTRCSSSEEARAQTCLLICIVLVCQGLPNMNDIIPYLAKRSTRILIRQHLSISSGARTHILSRITRSSPPL